MNIGKYKIRIEPSTNLAVKTFLKLVFPKEQEAVKIIKSKKSDLQQ